MSRKVVHIEPKFIRHFPKTKTRPDLHMIKERIFYDDGTTESNLRFIKDYKRPFWVTKPIYRTHKDKREFEELSKVEKHLTIESDMANSIASKIGMNGYYKNKMWDVKDSQYIYGADIKSPAFVMTDYRKKWPRNGQSTLYTNCALDIEADIDTKIVSVITVILDKKIRVFINKSLVSNIEDVKERVIKKLYDNIPIDKDGKPLLSIDDYNIDITVEKDNIDVIVNVFKQVHEWQPDILSIWNASYDMSTMIYNLEKAGIDPVDVFSDPNIPKEFRHFRFKEGQTVKITESGVRQNKDFQEIWHVYEVTASFYILDAMATYNYVRVGQGKVYGGYGIDNICKTNKVGGKLDLSNTKLKSGTIAWHKYMVRREPLNYIAYNIWDVMIMLLLDKKTQDIELNLGLLSDISSFDIFNSGPKRIIDSFFFYALDEEKMVLGVAPKKQSSDKVLGLDNWIITLEAFRTRNMGAKLIKGDNLISTNFRLQTTDVDQTSGYPNDTVASGLSRATTEAEVVKIEGIDKHTMKVNNMNLIYGDVSYIRYCNEVIGLPTIEDFHNKYLEKKMTA